MTRFNVISDVHLEFGPLPDLEGGECLLIAGDLGLVDRMSTYVPYLEEWCEQYEGVYMVMGNHEHYYGDFDASYTNIKKDTKHLANFKCLNNNYVEIGEDIVVIGATLWSDIDPASRHIIEAQMNDYRIIDNFGTEKSVKEHIFSRDYIEYMLKEYKDRKVIVLTHHAPSMQVPAMYRGNALNSAYGTDLEDMIKKYKPAYWIHGHTHVSREYTIGDTAIVCNPRGYYGHEENRQFNKDLTLEL